MPIIEDLGKDTTTGPGRFYTYAQVPAQPSYGLSGGPSTGGSGRQKRQISTQTRVSDSATRRRAILRRIAELDRENYNDQYLRHDTSNLDTLLAHSKRARSLNSRGSTPATRKILASRKTLSNLQDDDPEAVADVETILAMESKYPDVYLCSICGYESKYLCTKCGYRYCSMACDETHKETRCIKMYV